MPQRYRSSSRQGETTSPRIVRLAALFACFLGSLGACAGEKLTPTEPVQDPATLYWELTVNEHAINLLTTAPYDTFRLVATPRTFDGTPLENAPAPQFTSFDDRVVVGPDGLIRALKNAPMVKIEVTLTQGLVTHKDSAFVRVTTRSSPPPAIARLALEPRVFSLFGGGQQPADSAKGAMFGFPYYIPMLVPRAFDQDGNEIFGLLFWVEPSEPLAARYNSFANPIFALRLLRPGPITFYGSTAAYGAQLADTLAYRVGLPLVGFPGPRKVFAFGSTTPTYRFMTVTIGTGGYVTWQRPSDVPAFDITFDDPAHVGADTTFAAGDQQCGEGNAAGNIAPFGNANAEAGESSECARRFVVAGTYRYRSTALKSAVDSVVVVDERQ